MKWMNEWMNEWMNQSINQSIQPINYSFNQQKHLKKVFLIRGYVWQSHSLLQKWVWRWNVTSDKKMFKLKFLAKTFAKSIFWSEVTFVRRTHFSKIGTKSDSLWVWFEPVSPIWILKSDSAAPLMFQIVLDISISYWYQDLYCRIRIKSY